MKLKVLYAMEGQFYPIPLYQNLPFEVKILTDSIQVYESYSLEFMNEKQVTLYKDNDLTGIPEQVGVYPTNDTLTIHKTPFILATKQYNWQEVKGKKYYFTIHTAESLAAFFRSMIEIRQQSKDASIINLTITTQIPSRETDFLNQFMAEYVRYGLDDKTREATKTINFIN